MKPSPQPKVTLVGVTNPAIMYTTGDMAKDLLLAPPSPMQVVAIIWKQSKTEQPLDEIIQEVMHMTERELSDLLEAVMSGVPVVEAISFQFIIENASISWREQMVRHRVGTKAGAEVGVDWQMVDEVPNVADLSAWSQSMRLLDMSKFAEDRRYRTPDAVIAMGDDACEAWHFDMVNIQNAYARWAQQGVPLEDARDLIPLGATSRLSWSINLRTLQHIVGKRGCTILQLGLWGPIINGMIEELAEKVHPTFRNLVKPPCIKGDKYVGCIFTEDNARRLDGRDWNLPVCPLFIGCDNTDTGKEARRQYEEGSIRLIDDIKEEAEKRGAFWGRDPFSGQRA